MSTSVVASRPVRLVAGRWRRRLQHARMLAALVKVLSPLGFALVASHLVGGAGWVMVGAATALAGRWWLGALRSCYWRARWQFDARAAGLCRYAEPKINTTFDSLNDGDDDGDKEDTTLEVVPQLISIRCAGPVRTYIYRALPGSSMAEARMAAELMRTRWRAAQVDVEQPEGRWARGRVQLTVIGGSMIDRPLELPAALLPGVLDDEPTILPRRLPSPPLAFWGAAAGWLVGARFGDVERIHVAHLVIVGAAAVLFDNLKEIDAGGPVHVEE